MLTEDNAAFPLGATAELFIRATGLLSFARRQTDHVAPVVLDRNSLARALFSLGTFDIISAEGRERIFAQFEAEGGPLTD